MVPLTVRVGDRTHDLEVPHGAVLRDVLLERDITPHGRYARRLNCGGRGLCATCGVRIREGATEPDHWHDSLAERFGYPRLSCQIRVTEPMTVVVLPEKRVWGGRETDRREVSHSASGEAVSREDERSESSTGANGEGVSSGDERSESSEQANADRREGQK